jgi:hypothetical protein
MLIIPALVFLKIWLYARNRNISLLASLKKNKIVVAALLIICLSEIILIKYFLGTDYGYAGVEISLDKFITAFKAYGRTVYNLFLLMLIAVYIWFLAKRQEQAINHDFCYINWKNLLYIFGLFCLILLPQAFLYTKSGVGDRYMLPGIIGYAIAITYLLKAIKERSRLLANVFYLLIAAILVVQLNKAFTGAKNFALEGKHTNELLQTIEKNTQEDSPIVVVANPYINFEASDSLRIYLTYVSYRDNIYLVTYGDLNTDFLTDKFKEQEKIWYFLGVKSLLGMFNNQDFRKVKELEYIDCIVIMPRLKDEFLKDAPTWVDINQFKEYDFHFWSPFNLSFNLYLRKSS